VIFDQNKLKFQPDKSSTKSLMEVILSDGNSKIKSDVSAVKKTNKKIIAVGGAKGGVGKSMLAANLAVGLALLGQKVVLADLNLGGVRMSIFTPVLKRFPKHGTIFWIQK
jgi:Mrp family chromosome partitioning ATPase